MAVTWSLGGDLNPDLRITSEVHIRNRDRNSEWEINLPLRATVEVLCRYQKTL